MSHLCIPYLYEHQSNSVSDRSILRISVLIEKLILARLDVKYELSPRIGIYESAMWIVRWKETKCLCHGLTFFQKPFTYKKQIHEGTWLSRYCMACDGECRQERHFTRDIPMDGGFLCDKTLLHPQRPARSERNSYD
jgi:hypothetical protein